MKILKYPDPLLLVISQDVDDFGMDFQKLVTDMTWTIMADHSGVGLAAVQVGVPLRVMIYKTASGIFTALVNPEIIATKGILSIGSEGCLSLPGRLFAVSRYDRVQVRFSDRTGTNEETQWFIGDSARIIQHEIDHMDGVLLLARAGGDRWE